MGNTPNTSLAASISTTEQVCIQIPNGPATPAEATSHVSTTLPVVEEAAAVPSNTVSDPRTPLEIRVLNRLADLEVVRSLHSHLLPIQYPTTWYQNLFTRSHLCYMLVEPGTIPTSSEEAPLCLPTGTILDANSVATTSTAAEAVAAIQHLSLESQEVKSATGSCDILVGVATLRFESPPLIWGPTVAYLCTFGIHADRRRRGYAKKLMTYVLHDARARGITQFNLHVVHDNVPAIRAYEAAGFHQVEYLKDYYRLPIRGLVDAVAMTRSNSEVELDLSPLQNVKLPRNPAELMSQNSGLDNFCTIA